MTLGEIYERLDHFENYLSIRIDIIAEQPNRWLGHSINQLPTFEYYLKNCVHDKGGAYDFIANRYTFIMKPRIRIDQKIRLSKKIKLSYSYWMSTPFNFKEELL